jgi:hypothetical protein
MIVKTKNLFFKLFFKALFHKVLDSDFLRIDNSSRTLFRAISYDVMISAFLDEAECEDDRVRLSYIAAEVWII